MARVTVEDCIEEIPNRFELVLAAAQRAREIDLGSPLHVLRDNDKNTVVSLREIAEKHVTQEALEEGIIRRFQKSGQIDEEDEALLANQQEDDETDESHDEAELLAALREAMGEDLFKDGSE
ncbi:MAG: DNA-directed RNA polymerase subunit omega [Pseudomonadota bacterium]